jgi:hypothetical protein
MMERVPEARHVAIRVDGRPVGAHEGRKDSAICANRDTLIASLVQRGSAALARDHGRCQAGRRAAYRVADHADAPAAIP